MKKKIRNKEVKEYSPFADPNEFKIGDVLYFKKFRDWQADGQIVEGIYGEVVDVKETKDNYRFITVAFQDYRGENEAKVDPGEEPRDFVVGLQESQD